MQEVQLRDIELSAAAGPPINCIAYDVVVMLVRAVDICYNSVSFYTVNFFERAKIQTSFDTRLKYGRFY